MIGTLTYLWEVVPLRGVNEFKLHFKKIDPGAPSDLLKNPVNSARE